MLISFETDEKNIHGVEIIGKSVEAYISREAARKKEFIDLCFKKHYRGIYKCLPKFILKKIFHVKIYRNAIYLEYKYELYKFGKKVEEVKI